MMLVEGDDEEIVALADKIKHFSTVALRALPAGQRPNPSRQHADVDRGRIRLGVLVPRCVY